MSEAIKVFLVDDQELVRAGFAMLVGSQPDMVVVGQAGNGGEAVEQLSVTAADVVIMDVRMPRMDGVQATQILTDRAPRRASEERAPLDGGAMSKHAFPFAKSDDASGTSTLARGGEQRVILLTTFDLDEYAFAGLRAGAAGFLLKDTPPGDLLAAIRTVHAGDAVVAPTTTRRLVERFIAEVPAPDAPAPASLAGLTEREREVLLQIALGLSNPEIAAKFFVSEATVKTHVGRILAKTGLRDRVRLVILAYEAGLVRPPAV